MECDAKGAVKYIKRITKTAFNQMAPVLKKTAVPIMCNQIANEVAFVGACIRVYKSGK